MSDNEASTTDRLVEPSGDYPALDQLASLAPTALTDAHALPNGELPIGWDYRLLDPAPWRYAVDRLDEIINVLNPAEPTLEGASRALGVLARHVEAIRERLIGEELIEAERSMVADALEDARPPPQLFCPRLISLQATSTATRAYWRLANIDQFWPMCAGS